MYTILLIEDEEIIAQKMKDFLEGWNYKVVIPKDFKNILQVFLDTHPDLVCMDIVLPFLNGYHWAGEIRKISKVPILFISSIADNMNIVMALSQGADDYITKPFELQILQAKIQALLRRTYDFAGKTLVLEHKGLRFFPEETRVVFNDHEVELTRNESKILMLLLQQKNKIVSRDEMMNYLWKTDYYVDENTLSVNVNRLRKKLDSIGCQRFIETVKGMGYKV